MKSWERPDSASLSASYAKGVVAVPTTRNATCLDSVNAERLGQDEHLISRERAVTELLGSLGVEATNSSSYTSRTIFRVSVSTLPGDTRAPLPMPIGLPVLERTTNLERLGCPPLYGAHATLWVSPRGASPGLGCRACHHSLEDSADWGALGGLIGELVADYWTVPVIEMSGSPEGRRTITSSTSALASPALVRSRCSSGWVTPECGSLEEALGGIRVGTASHE